MFRIFAHSVDTSAQKYLVMKLIPDKGWEIVKSFDYLTEALFFVKSLV